MKTRTEPFKFSPSVEASLRPVTLVDGHTLRVAHFSGDMFRVASETGSAALYCVTIGAKSTCTCQDHLRRNRDCKHIQAVRAEAIRIVTSRKAPAAPSSRPARVPVTPSDDFADAIFAQPVRRTSLPASFEGI